ncbi:MAG: threonine/serine exporter family protein [Faecalibacterium prausnitzii]
MAAAGAGLVASWLSAVVRAARAARRLSEDQHRRADHAGVHSWLCSLLGTSASHAIIGTLMILTPGIAFTMGIRDFVQGDYLSGTIRMIDALLIAASIAIGTGLVLRLYTVLTGVVVV